MSDVAGPRSLACLNGEFAPPEETRVPIWDRGFLFGDSVYEVVRLYDGRCWLESAHLRRLEHSLAAVRITGVDLTQLMSRTRQTIEQSGVREGTVYIQITRGVAPRRHAFPAPGTPPTELIVVQPFDVRPTRLRQETGVGVVSRPDHRWKRCDIKSTNLLANVLAAQDAAEAECLEAVLFDARGYVTEATHSSVLWVRGGRIAATPEGPEILPGTTRHLARKLAERIGRSFVEEEVTLDELRTQTAEVMLVGTTIEVMPVVKLDGRPIRDGRPGPITRALQDAYAQALAEWLAAGPNAPDPWADFGVGMRRSSAHHDTSSASSVSLTTAAS